jgi:cholest-4-en-3-one 26-monooxygenase
MKPGDIDLNDPDSFRDGVPHEYFKILRTEAPVSWNEERQPQGPGFWVITKYDDLKFISRNPDLFSSTIGGTSIFTPPEEDMMGLRALMLNMDPPQHVKYRALVNRGFTPRMIQKIEPHIRDMTRQIIDRVAERGECDFVADIAAELPLQVICEMMGVPLEDRKYIYELSNLMIGFDDPEFQHSREDGKRAGTEMFLYAAKLGERARQHPADDLATVLVSADVDGEKLPELEFNSFFLLLMVAGNETTRTVTTHGMRLLMEHPEQRARLLANPSLIPSAIEEILRVSPPVNYFRRTATRDTEIRGVKISAGQKVAMWYPSVNRDEDVFPDSDRFDVVRSPNEHLAFGIGEHFCLGASLARLELKVVFEELLRRLPDIELSGPVRRLRSNFINGVKEMRVRFTPRPAQPARRAAAG